MKWGVILFLASRIEYTVESWEIMIKNIVLQRPCTFRKLMVCAAAAVQVFDQQRSCKQIIDFDTSFKDDSDRAIRTNVTLWHLELTLLHLQICQLAMLVTHITQKSKSTVGFSFIFWRWSGPDFLRGSNSKKFKGFPILLQSFRPKIIRKSFPVVFQSVQGDPTCQSDWGKNHVVLQKFRTFSHQFFTFQSRFFQSPHNFKSARVQIVSRVREVQNSAGFSCALPSEIFFLMHDWTSN